MLRDLLWLGTTIGLLALWCAAVLLVVATADRLAAWWSCRRTRPPAPADDWRSYHILWQTPPPSLINDPHGPARCRCAHCQARRAATR